MDYNLQRSKNDHLKIIQAIEKLHNDEFKTYIGNLVEWDNRYKFYNK